MQLCATGELTNHYREDIELFFFWYNLNKITFINGKYHIISNNSQR